MKYLLLFIVFSLKQCNLFSPTVPKVTSTATVVQVDTVTSTTITHPKAYDSQRNDSIINLLQGEWVFTNEEGHVSMMIFKKNKLITMHGKDTVYNSYESDTSTICILKEAFDDYFEMVYYCDCEKPLDEQDELGDCYYEYIRIFPDEVALANRMNLQTVAYTRTKIKKKR